MVLLAPTSKPAGKNVFFFFFLKYFTWEIFEWDVRVAVMARAANHCIKDMRLLFSVGFLNHHFPVSTA